MKSLPEVVVNTFERAQSRICTIMWVIEDSIAISSLIPRSRVMMASSTFRRVSTLNLGAILRIRFPLTLGTSGTVKLAAITSTLSFSAMNTALTSPLPPRMSRSKRIRSRLREQRAIREARDKGELARSKSLKKVGRCPIDNDSIPKLTMTVET